MTAKSEMVAWHFRREGIGDTLHLAVVFLQDEVGGFTRPHVALEPSLFLRAGCARLLLPPVHVVRKWGLLPGGAVAGDDGKDGGHLASQEPMLKNPGS